MGRKKIKIKPISEDRNRQVTLTKRKGGLFKKAYELGVLTNSEVALVVFDSQGRLYQYSSKPISEILTRLVNEHKPVEAHSPSTMAALIKKKKKCKGDEEDEEDEADGHDGSETDGHASTTSGAVGAPAVASALSEPPFAYRAPTAVGSSLAARRAVGIAPLSLPSQPPPTQPGGLPRLPSIGLGALPGTGTPQDWASMALPSPMTLLGFNFPASGPVLHTTKAGDLIVSQDAQKMQLQRQTSLGLGSFGLPRQFSADLGLPGFTPQFSLSRSNSQGDPWATFATPLLPGSSATGTGLGSHPGLQQLTGSMQPGGPLGTAADDPAVGFFTTAPASASAPGGMLEPESSGLGSLANAAADSVIADTSDVPIARKRPAPPSRLQPDGSDPEPEPATRASQRIRR